MPRDDSRHPPSPQASESWAIAKSIFPGYTIRRTVPEVRLQFSVADERGRLVTNLSSQRFPHLRQPIRGAADSSFLPTGRPSPADRHPARRQRFCAEIASREKLATQFFVRHVLRPQTDRAFLMAFSHEVKLWQPSTGDPAARARRWSGFSNLATPPICTTACSPPVSTSSRNPATRRRAAHPRALQRRRRHRQPARRWPTLSPWPSATRSRFSPSRFMPGVSPRPGDEVLQRTGRRNRWAVLMLPPPTRTSPLSSPRWSSRCAPSILSPSSRSSETPGFHALHIEMTGTGKLRIHARQGYYFDAP